MLPFDRFINRRECDRKADIGSANTQKTRNIVIDFGTVAVHASALNAWGKLL